MQNNGILPAGCSYNPSKKTVFETYYKIFENKSDIKELVTETYSEILDKDIRKAVVTHPELLYDFARKVFVEKNPKAIQKLVRGVIGSVAEEHKGNPDYAVLEGDFYMKMLENMFEGIKMEASTGQLSADIVPYIMLSVPLLRVFFPRTVLKKVTTTVPVNIPNIAMYFIRFLTQFEGQTYTEPYGSYLQENNNEVDVSPILRPLGSWQTNPVKLDLPVGPQNVIHILKQAGVISDSISDDTPLQKGSVKIIAIGLRDETNNQEAETPVDIVVDELGHLRGSAQVPDPADPTNTITVHVTGSIDFKTNEIVISSANVPSGKVAYVKLVARISLELRDNVQEVQIEFDRIDFHMNRIEKTIKFSPEFAYDAKALFNIDVQTELLTILATILAVNTDAQGLFEMIQAVKQAAPQNIETVDVSDATVSAYMLGPKYYYEAYIIPKLNALIGRMVAQTAITDAEFGLVCHPEDAAFFKSMNNYEAVVQHLGDSMAGAKVGQINKEVNVWDTPVVPKGHALLALIPRQSMAAIAVYAPYVTLFVPYPVANIGPAFTGIHRFGFRVVRPQGLGILRLAR